MHSKVTNDAFKGQKIFVGLDVHKKDFKVSVIAGGVFYKTFVSPPAGEKIAAFLKHNFPGAEYFSAYEAGFSGFWLHRQLAELGINSIVVNPSDIPTTDKERKQKEDHRDSRKLAKDLCAGQLSSIFIPDEKTIDDRSLLRSRDSIAKEIRRFKQRIKSFLYFQGIKFPEQYGQERRHWSKNFMNWLESIKFSHQSADQALRIHIDSLKFQRTLLLQITRQIRDLSRSNYYKQAVEALITVPGIGMLTAMYMLTELGDVRRFKNFNHLCSFVGLIPSTSSTGDNQRSTGITPRKNSQLRSMIIESAWMAIRNDPALMKSYLSYTVRMDKNKAIVRIAKKVLNRAIHVLRKNEKYEKNIVK
jgi:transposase